MKVFTSNDFYGHYPVGTAAVIIAKNEDEARLLLTQSLEEHRLTVNDFTLVEIDPAVSKAIILADGDY